MLKIYRIIQILLLVILVTQTASCGKKEKEENSNDSNLDVSTGLKFSSAEVHENGESKEIDLNDLPHQGCSYYQSNGKNVFYWNFGQDEGMKQTSNIEIIMNLDSLPRPGQNWKIDGSPEEIVIYHRFSGSEHQIWGLSGSDASCSVIIDSFNLSNTRRLVDPDDQKIKDVHDFASEGSLSCRLANKDSLIVFEAKMSCTGIATEEVK